MFNERDFWKNIFIRLWYTARNLEKYYIGAICEEIACQILKKLFPRCRIRVTGNFSGSHDIIIVCFSDCDRVFVEVKHISYLDRKKWERTHRMHLKNAINILLKGRHYLYMFVDPETGRYVIRHALYVLKSVNKIGLLQRYAHTRNFVKFVRKFFASRAYLTYKVYGVRFHPALRR